MRRERRELGSWSKMEKWGHEMKKMRDHQGDALRRILKGREGPIPFVHFSYPRLFSLLSPFSSLSFFFFSLHLFSTSSSAEQTLVQLLHSCRISRTTQLCSLLFFFSAFYSPLAIHSFTTTIFVAFFLFSISYLFLVRSFPFVHALCTIIPKSTSIPIFRSPRFIQPVHHLQRSCSLFSPRLVSPKHHCYT